MTKPATKQSCAQAWSGCITMNRAKQAPINPKAKGNKFSNLSVMGAFQGCNPSRMSCCVSALRPISHNRAILRKTTSFFLRRMWMECFTVSIGMGVASVSELFYVDVINQHGITITEETIFTFNRVVIRI